MSAPNPHLGLRHLALFVEPLEACEKFYIELLRMQCVWKPDADNVYLSSMQQDNLALHRAKPGSTPHDHQRLDHMGFILKDMQDVDAWYEFFKTHGVTLHSEPKTHRDGARSFYCADPAQNVIQMIYLP